MRLLILISSLILSACEPTDNNGRIHPKNYIELCLNGIVYYSLGSRMAVRYNPDGSLVPCGSSKTRVCVDEFDYSKDVPGVPQYDSKRCEGE